MSDLNAIKIHALRLELMISGAIQRDIIQCGDFADALQDMAGDLVDMIQASASECQPRSIEELESELRSIAKEGAPSRVVAVAAS